MVDKLAFINLGAPELLLILALALLLFGSKKLPELSRSLGSSLREIRKGMNGDDKNDKKEESKSSPSAS